MNKDIFKPFSKYRVNKDMTKLWYCEDWDSQPNPIPDELLKKLEATEEQHKDFQELLELDRQRVDAMYKELGIDPTKFTTSHSWKRPASASEE